MCVSSVMGAGCGLAGGPATLFTALVIPKRLALDQPLTAAALLLAERLDVEWINLKGPGSRAARSVKSLSLPSP
jgi:hypothetical protein